MDDFVEEIAKAFQVPVRYLQGPTKSTVDTRRYYDHHLRRVELHVAYLNHCLDREISIWLNPPPYFWLGADAEPPEIPYPEELL